MNPITLQTERLSLRPLLDNDLEAVHELLSLPETDQYNTLGIPETTIVTKLILRGLIDDNLEELRVNYFFAVELKSNDPAAASQFIGLIALKLARAKYKRGETWYKLHKNFWGKGYATEAVKAILDFGFDELKLHRIEAGCAVDNMGSIKVLEKSGMTREGRKRLALPLKTGWSDCFEFAILDTDTRS